MEYLTPVAPTDKPTPEPIRPPVPPAEMPTSPSAPPRKQAPSSAAPAAVPPQPPMPSANVVSLVFPGFFNRLGRALRRYRAKLGTMAALGFLCLLSSSLPAAANFALPILGVGAIPSVIISVSLSLVSGIVGGAAVLAIFAAAGLKIGLGRSLGLGFRNFLSWIWLVALQQAATSVAALALIVPGIILALRFSLAAPVLIMERRGGIECLARSRDLVYGRTFKLWWNLLLLGIFGVVAAAVAAAPFALAASFLKAGPMSFALPAQAIELGSVSSAGMLSATALIPMLVGPLVFLLIFLCFLLPLLQSFVQVFYEDCVATSGTSWIAHPARVRKYRVLAGIGLVFGLLATAAPLIMGAKTLSSLAELGPAKLSLSGKLTMADSSEPTDGSAAGGTAAASESEKEDAAAARDLKRVSQMNLIRLGLAGFLSANGSYPDSLGKLVGSFLSEPPTDPKTGETYEYTATQKDFTVKFTLERGALALSAGEHRLTKDGFDYKASTAAESAGSEEPGAGSEAEQPAEQANPLPPASQDPTVDADGDGLYFIEEQSLGTDPDKLDSDGDTLNDYDEVRVWDTDPLKQDSDGDGFGDWEEIFSGFDPTAVDVKLPDSDSDGLADTLESKVGTDYRRADSDDDGIADGDEYRIYHTDPEKADTDGDSFNDGQELADGFNPSGADRITQTQVDDFRSNEAKYGLHQPTPTTLKK